MLVVRLTHDAGAILPGLKQRLVRLLAEPYVGEILLEQGGFDVGILEPLRAAETADGGKAADLISDEMVEALYVVGDARRLQGPHRRLCRRRRRRSAAAAPPGRLPAGCRHAASLTGC